MPAVTGARNLRSTDNQSDVYFVHENVANGDVMLCKITRTQLDNIVAQGNQLQLITSAVQILPKSGYGNGVIDTMDLYADQFTGVVRLTIALAPDAQGNVQIYMGRIDSGNWVACANTPITIDGTMIELQHANGNSREANIIVSSNGTPYMEGH